MSVDQHLIIIAICAIGTLLTRALPFLLFSSKKPTPKYVSYLGGALPAAIFALLVVYCLRNVSILGGSHGIPELISLTLVVLLHLWRRNTILSIAAGTVVYMLLIQLVF